MSEQQTFSFMFKPKPDCQWVLSGSAGSKREIIKYWSGNTPKDVYGLIDDLLEGGVEFEALSYQGVDAMDKVGIFKAMLAEQKELAELVSTAETKPRKGARL